MNVYLSPLGKQMQIFQQDLIEAFLHKQGHTLTQRMLVSGNSVDQGELWICAIYIKEWLTKSKMNEGN